MTIIAVIPARAGSKRLPRKNVIDFFGKPIITYTIEAALATGLFERVVVSTEDEEIAKVSETFGAEVSVRPPELTTDTARVLDVCLHVLDVEKSRGRNYDILCCLYATAPLRTAEDIKRTVELVRSGQCDFAVAVSEFHFPPHQALIINEFGNLVPMWPDLANKQSQDMPTMVSDNGSTYAVSVPALRREKTFFGRRLKGYVMPRARSVDVDLVEDLEIARLYAKGLSL